MKSWTPIGTLVLLVACASTKSDQELGSLTDQDLMVHSDTLVTHNDPEYRSKVLAVLAERFSWSPEDRGRVYQRQIWVGATREQVFASFGTPQHISTHQDQHGMSDAWRYDNLEPGCWSLTFEDGKLASWTKSANK